MTFNIPTLAILPTYQCNIKCQHCGSSCGPNDTERMANSEIFSIIDQAVELGCQSLVLSGGEPTLLFQDLVAILNYSKRHPAIINRRMVTNGHWASSLEKATELLTMWLEAGLSEINISCGEFHQEFIPIERVVNAYKAASSMNFDTVLLGGEFLREGKNKITPSMFSHLIGYKLPNPNQQSPFVKKCRGMQCASAMNFGRGSSIDSDDLIYADISLIKSNCVDLFTNMTIHPNGKVTACCGVMTRGDSILDIGDWRKQSLKEIADDASNDLILNIIRYFGLKELKSFLLTKDPSLTFKYRYTNICDLCADIICNPKCIELMYNYANEIHDATLVKKLIIDSVARESFSYQDESQ